MLHSRQCLWEMFCFNSFKDCIAKKECIIYQKNKTDPCGSGYEKLVQNKTDDGSGFLLSYADTFENIYLTIHMHNLTVYQVKSIEFHYHQSCYRELSRKPKEKADKTSQICYENLKKFVQVHAIDLGEVMKANYLQFMKITKAMRVLRLKKIQSIDLRQTENGRKVQHVLC